MRIIPGGALRGALDATQISRRLGALSVELHTNLDQVDRVRHRPGGHGAEGPGQETLPRGLLLGGRGRRRHRGRADERGGASCSRRQSVTPATELSTSRRHPFGFVYGPWLALMSGPISVKAETILRFSESFLGDPRRIGRVQNDGTPRPREGSDRDRDVTRPRERRRSISHPGSGHPHDTRTVGGAPRRGTTSPEATTILINGDDGQGPRRAGSRAAGGQDAVRQRPGERAVVHIAHRAAGGGQPPAPGAAHRANRASHERARERVRGFRHRRRHETLQLVHVHADQIKPPRRGAASERRRARERRQRGRRGRRASRSIRARRRPPR